VIVATGRFASASRAWPVVHPETSTSALMVATLSGAAGRGRPGDVAHDAEQRDREGRTGSRLASRAPSEAVRVTQARSLLVPERSDEAVHVPPGIRL